MTNLPPQSNKPLENHPDNQGLVTAAKGGGITFAGKLTSYAFSFIFSIVLARMLGAAGLGIYTLALTIVGIVAAISFLGLDGGMDRYIPIFIKQKNFRAVSGVIQIGGGITLLVSLLLTAVLYIFAAPFTNAINSPEILPAFKVAVLAIPLLVLLNAVSSVIKSYKQMQYEVYTRDLIFNLVKLILSVAAIVLGYGVWGVTWAYVISTFIAVGAGLYFAHKLFPITQSLQQAEYDFREMFRFSTPLYFSRLLNQFSGKFETLILGFVGIVADVGIYATILRLSTIGNLFFASLRKISVPLISEMYSQGNYAELKQLYQTTTKWTITFNFPIFLIFLLFSETLLAILFGDEFTAGSLGLIILAAGALFNASTGACGVVINMTGHTKLALINSAIYLATTLILDFILIPEYQLLGAALAGALTIVINNTLRLIEVYFIIPGMLPFNLSFWKPVTAFLVSGGVTYGLMRFLTLEVPILELLIGTPVMIISYGAIVLALGLSNEDKLIVGKISNRISRFAPFMKKSG